MARDVLVVPVSTVASESAFSQGRQMIGDTRHSLGNNALDVLVCLRDWIRSERRNQGIEDSLEQDDNLEEILLTDQAPSMAPTPEHNGNDMEEITQRIRTVEEVIKRANSTKYGLVAGVMTNDLNNANTVSRSIRAGAIWINCFFAIDPDCPFGGYKCSGFERDLGMEGLHKYLQVKSVATPIYNSPWL